MRIKLRYDKQTQTLTADEIAGNDITISIGDPFDYDTHIDLYVNLDVDLIAMNSIIDIQEEI